MWPLVKRELEQMVTTTLRSSLISHAVFMIIAIGLMWLLGPKNIGYLDTNSINVLIFVFGMLMVGQFYTQFNLEEDASYGQLIFLQLLPIRTVDIIHAKYLSNLFVACAAFVWASLLISINLWMNDTLTMYGWLDGVVFIAFLLLLIASSLSWYFFIGNKRGFVVMYILSISWMVVMFIALGPVKDGITISFELFSSLLLCVAITIYLFSWAFSIKRIQKKGIPFQCESVEIDQQSERIEALKRRYKKRKERET